LNDEIESQWKVNKGVKEKIRNQKNKGQIKRNTILKIVNKELNWKGKKSIKKLREKKSKE
jgi:CO dehydrogenase/acetyl-CoA synthase alpha subunit